MARVRLSGEQRRASLLDAAATVIVDHGMAALTMERLAATAGVSKALPYQHFENADDLVIALYTREMDAVGDRIRDAISSVEPTDLEGLVRSSVHAYFDLLAERGTLLAILARAERVSRLQATADGMARVSLARAFSTSTGMDQATGELVAGMVATTVVGAVEAWVKGLASRREIEAVFTWVVTGGVQMVAARKAEASVLET